jgi:hypothetical protein
VSLANMKPYQVKYNEPVSGQIQGYRITLSPVTLGEKSLVDIRIRLVVLGRIPPR